MKSHTFFWKPSQSHITYKRPNIIPLEDQILPLLYKNKAIKNKKSLELLVGKTGRRDQIDGLKYKYSQVPSCNSNRSWANVIRKRKDCSAFSFLNRTIGNIHIEYLVKEVPMSIKTAVNFYLNNHSSVRGNKFESGEMCPVGRRVDVRTSCLTNYKNRKRKLLGDDHKILNECSVDFDSILKTTCCAESYLSTINVMIKRDNISTVKCNGNDFPVLPTMCVSDSLTNALHCDKSDGCRSFSIFFPSTEGAITWFLVPAISLAIEISAPMVLSWDAVRCPHYSVSTVPGIYSLFASSSSAVTRRLAIRKSFGKSNHSLVKVNERCYVRARLREMTNDAGLNLKDFPDNIFMNRIARVLAIESKLKYILVQFEGHLHTLGPVKFKSDHVCRWDFVENLIE